MREGSSLTQYQQEIDDLEKTLKTLGGIKTYSSSSREIIDQTIQRTREKIERLEEIKAVLKAGYKEIVPPKDDKYLKRGLFGPDPRPHKFLVGWILAIGISAWILYSLAFVYFITPEADKAAAIILMGIFAFLTTMVFSAVLVVRNNATLRKLGFSVYEDAFFKGKISSSQMRIYQEEIYRIQQNKIPLRSIKVLAPPETFKRAGKKGVATIFGEVFGHYFLIAQLKIG